VFFPPGLIKFGFFLLYNQLAFSYDLVAWLVSFGQWADWRRTGLQYLQPGHTLELAFGSGGLYADMVARGIKPVGIDLSPYMARLTAKRLARRRLPGSILRSRAQALPFPTGHFANAIATFPTPYIFEAETLAEIRRVLVNDRQAPGRLIIVMQGELKRLGWLTPVLEWLYRVTGQREDLAPDPLAVLHAAGFEAHWAQARFETAEAQLLIAHKT